MSIWNPDITGAVETIEVVGNTVYVGGNFTQIGGVSRSKIGAIEAVSGNATSWNPNADGTVYEIKINGSIAYVGGFFNNIGGQVRNAIAAINTGNNNATAWNPFAPTTVSGMAIAGGLVYAGGTFTQIGGQPRNYLGSVDPSTGNATSWNAGAGANGFVKEVSVYGSTIYVGGNFQKFGGKCRAFFLALSDQPLPVSFGAINASISNNKLLVSWSTLKETNNSHFDIEASKDGNNFTKIATVSSKANNGNSSSPLNYEASVSLQEVAIMGAIGLLALLFPFAGRKKHRCLMGGLMITGFIALSISGCRKNEIISNSSTQKIYIRVVQNDIDGNKSYSKVVIAEVR